MGVYHALKNILGMGADADALEPILAALGIDAAAVNYSPDTPQIIVSLKIHGQVKHALIPTGRVFTRPQICAAIAAGRLADLDPASHRDPSLEPPNGQ